jgi:hypothetical protein
MPTESKIIYGNNIISNISHTNFLGLVTDNILAWSNHIEEMVSKWSSVCYAYICSTIYVLLIANNDLLHSFPPIMSYLIYFAETHLLVRKSLNLKKKSISIIIGHRNKDSCRNLFNRWESYHLNHSIFLSILLFVVKNRDHFTTNYDS